MTVGAIGSEMDERLDDFDDADDNIEETFLTLQVAGTEYAVCLTHVIEIVVGQSVTPVPDVPAFIAGVINLRGKIIPIMDVRSRFGLARTEYHERLAIVVAEVDGVSTGLAVDEVKDVLRIPASEMAAPIDTRGASSGFIRGIGKREDSLAFVLDVERLLRVDEVAAAEAGRALSTQNSEIQA